jgi:hypothetical protein
VTTLQYIKINQKISIQRWNLPYFGRDGVVVPTAAAPAAVVVVVVVVELGTVAVDGFDGAGWK